MHLIKNKGPDIDKIYLCVKNPFESKHQLPINGREKVGIKSLKNSKALIHYSHTIDVYEKLKTIIQQKKKSVNSSWWHDSKYGT